MDVGEDGGDLTADFAKAVDAGAVASQGQDGVNLIFLVEDFLGLIEVNPGGSVVDEVPWRMGLGDEVIFSVESGGVSFFEAE